MGVGLPGPIRSSTLCTDVPFCLILIWCVGCGSVPGKCKTSPAASLFDPEEAVSLCVVDIEVRMTLYHLWNPHIVRRRPSATPAFQVYFAQVHDAVSFQVVTVGSRELRVRFTRLLIATGGHVEYTAHSRRDRCPRWNFGTGPGTPALAKPPIDNTVLS